MSARAHHSYGTLSDRYQINTDWHDLKRHARTGIENDSSMTGITRVPCTVREEQDWGQLLLKYASLLFLSA
jgi:hypothetical protein